MMSITRCGSVSWRRYILSPYAVDGLSHLGVSDLIAIRLPPRMLISLPANRDMLWASFAG